MSRNRKSPRRSTGKPGATRSVTRLRYVLTRLVNRVNGGLITVAGYLASIGATPAFVDRFGSAFGTKASREFQAVYGEKPPQAGLALRKGRLFRAFAYTAAQLPVLASAAAKYERTAALIPTPALVEEPPVNTTAPAAEPEPEPAPVVESATIKPAQLARELTARTGLPRTYTTRRIGEITRRASLLTQTMADVATQIITTDNANGTAAREIAADVEYADAEARFDRQAA